MGTTGSSDKIGMNSALPDIIARVREYAKVPIAVGFGVATRDHVNVVYDAGADGVVVGSKLVSIIKNAQKGKAADEVQSFCSILTGKGEPARVRSPLPRSSSSVSTSAKTATLVGDNGPNGNAKLVELPARFGQFGGQYVPEALVDCLAELEEAHKSAMADPKFLEEFRSFYGYMGRPSRLYLAENLTKDAGGAKIWLKREDLYAFVFFPWQRL
jgi:tryptophan synthase